MKKSWQKKIRTAFLLLGIFLHAGFFTLTAFAATPNRTLMAAVPAYAAASTPCTDPTPPPGSAPPPASTPIPDPDPMPDKDLEQSEQDKCMAAGTLPHIDYHPCSWYAEKEVIKIQKGYYCCEAQLAKTSFIGPYSSITEFIAYIYRQAMMLALALAVLIITIAGFRWMFARGNTGAVAEARKMISNTLVGLVLALGSYTLLYAINPDLVSLKKIKPINIEQERLQIEIEESPTPAPDYVDDDKPDPGKIIDRINQNMPLYKQVAQAMDIPWELIATTHYQEAANRPDKSILNGFDICNNKDSKCSECNGGKTQLNDARCAARILREKAQSTYASSKNVNYTEHAQKFCLAQTTNDAANPHGAIANTLFRYNGICPHKSLADLGKHGTCLNVDGSGYVMNNFSSDPRYQHMAFAGYVASDCKPGCTIFKHWSGDGGLRFFTRLKNPANFDASGKLIKLD